MRPDGRCTKSNELNADLVRNIFHLAQMRVHLVTGFMDGFERRTAQLQRTAGL